MTHVKDDSAIWSALEQIIKNGFDGLDTAVSILINEAMRIKRSRGCLKPSLGSAPRPVKAMPTDTSPKQ